MTRLISFRTCIRRECPADIRQRHAGTASGERGPRVVRRCLALCVGVLIVGSGDGVSASEPGRQEAIVTDVETVAMGSESPPADSNQTPTCIAWDLAGVVLRGCLWRGEEGVHVGICLGQGDDRNCWSTAIWSTRASRPYSCFKTRGWSPERYLPCSSLLSL
jgi:hypothetical protein